MQFNDVHTDGGLKKLNGFLTARSYLEGFQFSAADNATFVKLAGAPDASKYPNVYRCPWLSPKAAAPAAAKPATPKPATPKAATPKAAKPADDDDDDDMFGDDDEEEDEAAKAAAKKRADAAKASKKEKAKPIERSQVVIEVKPWEAETDLEALAIKIKALEVNGLTWGESHKLVPVAFGIKKLLVQCIIIDELVLLDDITEAIEQFEDDVQSVDVASMNKM
ncbi:hypothetical protein SPRG_19459 [Saprolegnia parasitica CBS 223.65]|uniref:Translation elongation factor EF1B beta/delta subunit guanine nucleotide exchange domain-containing protein n=1 Tax=Saprolegnia parasitica (strain CBS 223.65) TaxID=695850 RepID=A0A067D0F2_SAPPC|nr:hypothetical protein SPRG_19459 [Saprolegnia parasitica CBS 223.65]KDO32532.1 hypothetical protein SPRG_19459 [Saprolegnia parasitica CBS 223.65]|eukprot:XP_012197064.1 hypothetical protein SPRG_19459 [Saprolegnia parasitica CBS 223.65]